MKVLLQSRRTLFTVPGGDTIQILKTQEYLEKVGVQCDLSLELEPDLRNYDIVHLFNITRPQEVFVQARNAQRQGKKVIISPIYVQYTEYERNARSFPFRILSNVLSPHQLEYLKVLARVIKNKEFHKGSRLVIKNGYRNAVEKTLAICNGLLPNSESEMQRLRNDFELNSIPHWIVPNAVDQYIFDVNSVKISDKWLQFKDCVLCAARIEGRKNQLNVVRAMRRLPYKLVLVGSEAPNHKAYAEKVRYEAGPNVFFLGQLSHEDIAELYYLAKVHVLASWMETTGLSSLEAGTMNTNLVITDKGDTMDYFKDLVYYCSPESIESIRQAILDAWSNPINPDLRNMILEHYTWENTARVTLESYSNIVGGEGYGRAGINAAFSNSNYSYL